MPALRQAGLGLLAVALGLVACNSRSPGSSGSEDATPVTRSMAAPAGEAHRYALVIGNDNYQNVTPLRNARADAKAVAAALRAVGFKVTLEQDVTLTRLKAALRAFKSQIAGGDDAVFYFSGHGVQFDGTNYLIPTDLVPQNQEQVQDDAVPLQRVLDDLHDQKARFALAIVDACRDNPFKDKGSSRAIGGRGLAPVTAATGQMVMYSAGTGQEALDRLSDSDNDPNGVFTRVLIKEISKPGVPANQLLKNVQSQVVDLAEQVHQVQVPALYDQSLGEFYFVPPQASAASAAPSAAPAPAPAPAAGASDAIHVQTSDELEQSFWNRIKDSTDPADFRDYSRQYPSGAHVGEATLMLRRLDRTAHKREPAAATAGSAALVPADATAPPVQQVSMNVPVRRGFTTTPGTYGGYTTSSLSPGAQMHGRMTLQRNGDFEYRGDNGVKVSGNLDFSNPDNVTGTGTVTQPKVLGVAIMRYPDGSTSTQMALRCRIVNGKLQGVYTDPFEKGEVAFDLSSPR